MTIAYRDGSDLDLDQLAELFDEAGWSGRTRDRDKLARFVRGSTFVVTAWDGDRLVGHARAISDGVFNAYVSTVAVRASHRRRGIGTEMLRILVDGRDEIKFVLHTSAQGRSVYERVGFEPASDMLVRPRRR